MPDRFNYGQLMHKAMRGLMSEVLSEVAEDGLPGDHHFFITFDTTHPGVDMSAALKARFPSEMTIVLQHEFWDLTVLSDRFSVVLTFKDVPETLVIPFTAISVFADPSCEFGLRFSPQPDEDGPPPVNLKDFARDERDDGDEPGPDDDGPRGGVVSLDQFRKS